MWASLLAQLVKNLPAVQETWVWSQGREDPLEKEMASHASTLAWKIPWTEEPGGLQPMGSQRVRHDWVTSLSLSLFIVYLGLSDDSVVKNPPAMQEMWVRSLGWEDGLEEDMATHSSIPAWRVPWTEEPGGLQSMGSQRVGQTAIGHSTYSIHMSVPISQFLLTAFALLGVHMFALYICASISALQIGASLPFF